MWCSCVHVYELACVCARTRVHVLVVDIKDLVPHSSALFVKAGFFH